MLVKPKEGLKVLDPITKRHLPVEGKDVPESAYWLRRLKAGDVVLIAQIHDSRFGEQ